MQNNDIFKSPTLTPAHYEKKKFPERTPASLLPGMAAMSFTDLLANTADNKVKIGTHWYRPPRPQPPRSFVAQK
jgi:hypothetical protein